MASPLLDANASLSWTDTAVPRSIAPPKLTPSTAAAFKASPSTAAETGGAPHVCSDHTFYGTIETPCAWGGE